MTSLRKLLLPAALSSAVVLAACSSSNKTTSDTASTTSSSTTTTVLGDSTSTSAAPATTPATTAAPVVTNPPATTAAPEGPKVTQMVVDQPDCSSGGSFSLSLKWQVTGSPDRVYIAIDNPDGPYFDDIGNSGTLDVPFTCGDTQVYYIVAIKGSQKDVESRTRP